MTKIPPTVPALPRPNLYRRDVSAIASITWLKEGWTDFWFKPGLSICYGTAIFLISLAVVWCLFWLKLDYIVFPALAGFLVVGPFLAIGLYEKSRCIADRQPVTLTSMMIVKVASGGQIFFVGMLLCLLMVLWMRAAVIIYALFFGMRTFPGFDHIASMLFTTSTGWMMITVGTVVGGLFAAFAFAISAFSIPMLLNDRVDALTAMGTSVALVWNNLTVMVAWGAIVLGLFALSLATGFVGLIFVFPVLGHGAWHAYRALR